MAKVRSKKEHKKRVAKRNNIIAQERKKVEKAQKEFLMKLIDEEKQKGLFNNPTQLPPMTPIPTATPIEGPTIGMEGPRI